MRTAAGQGCTSKTSVPLLPGHFSENNPYTVYHLSCGSAESESERINES